MRDLKPPFKFDLEELLTGARRKSISRIGSVSINLPFLSFSLNPNDLEKKIAREIVIRMSDRRVLSASECCDNCIDEAIASLNEIRQIIVDAQVELASISDSPLFLLLEMQAEAIRQFLTFEQRLNGAEITSSVIVYSNSSFRRPPSLREQYFAALEMLRTHLRGCLIQISKISDVEIPKIKCLIGYEHAWQIEAYEEPKFISKGETNT